MSWVWKSGPDDPQQRYVLLKLADNANQDGRCWPSLAEIAMTTRLSESTVRRCVNGLEKGGWLEVNRGLGRSKNSQYTLIEKVSGSNHLEEKVSQRKVSHRLIKGVTQTEKGVSLKKPPTPPLVEEPSRTTNEPSQGELTLLSPLAPPEPKLRPEEFANTWNRLRGMSRRWTSSLKAGAGKGYENELRAHPGSFREGCRELPGEAVPVRG